MADAYYYSSSAGAMSLAGAINGSATSMVVDTVAGLPGSVPFKLVIDPGLSSEEIVKVTVVAGTTLTIARGWDGTSGQAHSNLASVRHMVTAEDLRLARQHESATSAVHGVVGAIVGTSDSQSLTNKDFTGATNTFPTSLARQADLTTEANSRVAHQNATNAHGTTTAVVGVDDVQTLKNKTLDGGLNTFTNIPSVAVVGLDPLVTDATAAVGLQSGYTEGALVIKLRRLGKRVTCSGSVVRGSGATDNLFSVVSLYRPSADRPLGVAMSSGASLHGLVISAAGMVSMQGAAGYQNSGLPVGATLQFNLSWLVD